MHTNIPAVVGPTKFPKKNDEVHIPRRNFYFSKHVIERD